MSIYENALKNSHLSFIDVKNGNEYSLQDLSIILSTSEKKELVFLYLDTSITSMAAYWSFMKTNNCLALLSPNLTAHFKTELEELYKPSFIFDESRSFIDGYELTEEGTIKYFRNKKISETEIHDKIKILLSTSGTTGSPKFVKLSDDNLLSNANSICDYLPIKKTDNTPLNLPIYYSYGLSILNSNSLSGGRIFCGDKDILQKEFWTNMENFGYSSIAGVPYVFEMLDRIGFTKKNYTTLRYITQAGGKLQESLVRKYLDYSNKNNIQFFVMYGQTEATARMAYLPPENSIDKPDSIGIPIKNGRFEIDRETNELCYFGPNIFGGYVNSPYELSSYEKLEVLRTGDIAKSDKRWFLLYYRKIKTIREIIR